MAELVDARDLASWRVRRHGLTRPRFDTPGQAVNALGAVQAQDYGPACWSLSQRVRSRPDQAAFDELYRQGAILRTHLLRPTWHFVTPADIRWLLALTAPRVHAVNAYYYRRFGLGRDLLERCTGVLADALAGGPLTRVELQAELAGAGVSAQGLQLAYILMYAELEGVICSGGLRGRQHTYALLAERVPDRPVPDRQESLRELVLRYVDGHGPATLKDLAGWSSVTLADLRDGIEVASDRLVRTVLDDVTYYSTGPPGPSEPADGPAVHLLPQYDEYFMGYSQSRFLLDVSGAVQAPRSAALHPNGLVVDGQVIGFWRRTVERGQLMVDAQLLGPIGPDLQRGIEAAARWHAEFLGLSSSSTVSHRAGQPPQETFAQGS